MSEATTQQADPFAPCPTCGHQPAGLAIEISPVNRVLFTTGSEQAAIRTAYRLMPEAPRDLVRAIVRYVRAGESR